MNKLFSVFSVVIFSMSLFMFTSCEIIEAEPDSDTSENSFGWNGEEDMSTVPTSTNFGFGNGNLPSSVNLVPNFPPIGAQGNYGTCVTWAVAYNVKTAINGMEKGLNSNQLSSSSNQFSPKDLFLAIPDHLKNPYCDGTDFYAALEELQNRGTATMQTVPYESMNGCSESNVQSSWTNEANQNKIKYWRKIQPSVLSIKENIANNIPVIMGARISDNFRSWSSSNVLSSSTTFSNNPYHALVIAGYDDSKGANGAFRIINSWGEYWGDNGYIWIDYDYLINEFCTDSDGDKPLFIVANEGGNTPLDNNPPPNNNSGVDLSPWVFADYSLYPFGGAETERNIEFNIYNEGNQSASPSSSWSFYYIYFNAFDANDYGVIFYDDFNTSVNANTFNCVTNYNCVFNYSIPGGSSFAESVWGNSSVQRQYYMPSISGRYYLVMVADAGDKFAEQDEINNLFHTTIDPIYFQNGYAPRDLNTTKNDAALDAFNFQNDLEVSSENLKQSKYNTAVTPHFPNAYTPDEIIDFLKKEKRNGILDTKVGEYIQQNNTRPYSN